MKGSYFTRRIIEGRGNPKLNSDISEDIDLPEGEIYILRGKLNSQRISKQLEELVEG